MYDADILHNCLLESLLNIENKNKNKLFYEKMQVLGFVKMCVFLHLNLGKWKWFFK